MTDTPHHIEWVDGTPVYLKEPFDLSFLREYGTVFAVFDGQDSGNLCFGLQQGERRLFLKFAGAPTLRYGGDPRDAMARLWEVAPIYRELAHPNLVRLHRIEEVGFGVGALFDWADGLCMGKQYAQSRRQFMALGLAHKQQVYRDVLCFHDHVAKRGYVAIDFYDGSVLYDDTRKKTVICDVDFYAKAPYVNRMGRMWGSSRFMAPEEFERGAPIDERTNVYGMGAMAFELFCGGDRTGANWPLGQGRLAVVRRAVSPEPAQRQPTVGTLVAQWLSADLT